MIKRLASGRAPAIAATFLLAGVASPASGQAAAMAEAPVQVTASATVVNPAPVAAPSVSVPLPAMTPEQPGRAAVLSPAPRPESGVTTYGTAADVRPAVSHASLWPKVYANRTGAELNAEEHCIAVAVYHEARGEPLDGQLAVAEVIMNRAASGRYPATWCRVVRQPWQFSFVNPRTGRFPGVDRASTAWANAQAITRIAVNNLADALPSDVLWYHADFVSPSWGRRLARVDQIGAHIFYRASQRS